MNSEISSIVDLIEDYGLRNMTHPNDTVKIFAASMLVDHEVIRRMAAINTRNINENKLFVGGVCK